MLFANLSLQKTVHSVLLVQIINQNPKPLTPKPRAHPMSKARAKLFAVAQLLQTERMITTITAFTINIPTTTNNIMISLLIILVIIDITMFFY